MVDPLHKERVPIIVLGHPLLTFNKNSMTITEYTISLSNVHLYAHHGVMPQEQEIGAWFTVDAELAVSDHSCAVTDEIGGTVSYADVYGLIVREMSSPSKLLENVAHRIIRCIFDEFAVVSRVEVKITKDTPPMGGDRLSAAVTLKAHR